MTSVYLVDYRGIDVESANQLRRRIHSEGGGDFEYRVAKNSVLRRACVGTDVAQIAEHFQGPTAVALSYGDDHGLAKILLDFAKDHEAFELRAGLLEGRPIDGGEIAEFANLPSLEALRATLVGLIRPPPRSSSGSSRNRARRSPGCWRRRVASRAREDSRIRRSALRPSHPTMGARKRTKRYG